MAKSAPEGDSGPADALPAGDCLADDLIVERRGRLGVITLNRPKVLNVLDLGMVRGLTAALADLARDRDVAAVAIQGAGDRACCAGGDMRALAAVMAGDAAVWQARKREFFSLGYRLSYTIQTFPKPFLALMDGVTMGGGSGISITGRYRIATERTLFAVPEPAIGLFADVGATWVLNRCPGETGIYLALSGVRLRAADMVARNLASHALPAVRLPDLLDDLAAASRLDDDGIGACLARHAAVPGDSVIARRQEAIDRIFGAASVEDIAEALEREGEPWTDEALAAIRRAAPLSLKVTLRQWRGGRVLDLAEALAIEYRLALRLVDGDDFHEGVRAILVDKDNQPKWRPDSLDAVGTLTVAQLFARFADASEEWPDRPARLIA
ncbi:MAG: enoyl-CoA hydratase/isomerase family protein [Telmatospirillum sp.]|nr:enoyl-CoA hydratase/isomerase family protein [Telmatospirillum sp.]